MPVIFSNAVVEKLYSLNWMSEKSAEAAKLQYDDFLSLECKKYYDKFSEFDFKVGELDKFLGAFLHKNKKFIDFWDVCKIAFVLSYGQSAIERGFSVNKDLLVKNLGEQSLIGQHLICDYFTSLDTNIYEYVIPNNLVKSCKLAYSNYKIALEQTKENTKACENNRKRKLKVDEIVEVEKQRDSIALCIETLDKDIAQYCLEAEQKAI